MVLESSTMRILGRCFGFDIMSKLSIFQNISSRVRAQYIGRLKNVNGQSVGSWVNYLGRLALGSRRYMYSLSNKDSQTYGPQVYQF